MLRREDRGARVAREADEGAAVGLHEHLLREDLGRRPVGDLVAVEAEHAVPRARLLDVVGGDEHGAPARDERREALDALDAVGLRDRADHTFGALSGGQRQRVLVARALVQRAELLLLDEPFSGVDRPSASLLSDLIDRLAAEGRGVIVATHDVEQARRWDLVLCLNRRQVAFGPPEPTLTRPVLEATYGGAIVELPARAGAGRAVLPAHHHAD